MGVVAEQQVQHRHEVRLAGAEAALQEGGLGLAVADGGGHEAERLVEGLGQLVGDDVLVDGRRGPRPPIPWVSLRTKSPSWTWVGMSISSRMSGHRWSCGCFFLVGVVGSWWVVARR